MKWQRVAAGLGLTATLGAAWAQTDFSRRDLRLGNEALARQAHLEALHRYERIDPEGANGGTALFNRGVTLAESGDNQGAERAFRLALARLPDEDERVLAYYNLGTVLARQKRWTESLETLHYALRRRPSPEARFNYAWVLARLNEQRSQGPQPQPPPPAQPLDALTRERLVGAAHQLDAGIGRVVKTPTSSSRQATDR